MKLKILSVVMMMLLSNVAEARCVCACVEGRIRAVCDWDYERATTICYGGYCSGDRLID